MHANNACPFCINPLSSIKGIWTCPNENCSSLDMIQLLREDMPQRDAHFTHAFRTSLAPEKEMTSQIFLQECLRFVANEKCSHHETYTMEDVFTYQGMEYLGKLARTNQEIASAMSEDFLFAVEQTFRKLLRFILTSHETNQWNILIEELCCDEIDEESLFESFGDHLVDYMNERNMLSEDEEILPSPQWKTLSWV